MSLPSSFRHFEPRIWTVRDSFGNENYDYILKKQTEDWKKKEGGETENIDFNV